MKKSIIIIAAFAAIVSFAACEREIPSESQVSGEGLCLTLTCGDINTKSKPGVGNENLIRTADVFLFNSTDPEYKHHWRFAPDAESFFTCFIQAAVIMDGTYKVYSIVNYPGPETDFIVSGTEATLDQLQALALSESANRTFTAGGASGITPASDEDLSLVMTGIAEDITVHAEPGKTLVGNAEIELTRIPAKVTMDFYLKDEVTSTKGNVTETWTPLTDGTNIRLYLCNGASEALVGGADTSSDLFDYAPNLDNTPLESDKTGYSTAFSSVAFYTYPETWTYGDAKEPYLKLIVPWKLTRSTAGMVQESQKEFYYKVMLPTDTFESNNWYHLVLDVTQLGGNADDDAVNVPCGYQVLNWRTGTTITSTMSPGYYLDVNVPDTKNIKFYGDELDISYFASGPVNIISKVKEWEEYNSNAPHQSETGTSAVSKPEDGDYIHISNTLNSNFDTNQYDVSPYTYTIILGLVGDTAGQFNDTLKVTQYPPLYIENNNTHVTSNTNPNVWVNNSSSTSGNQRVWDSSNTSTNGNITTNYIPHFLGAVIANTTAVPTNYDITATNQNPNIYSVTTTILDFNPTVDGSAFETVLGDPRAAATDEYSTVLKGSGSGLTDYRPTADNTQNVISPKFITASSYGKTFSLSYEGARKRCAAYQESGYPAGRWRLPTQAEILFLQKLNSDQKIPSLFTTTQTSGYWAAGQLLFIKDSEGKDKFMDFSSENARWIGGSIGVGYTVNGTDYTTSVRCVYDTWYWGDDPVSGSNWLGFRTSLE